ncbi:MAG: ArsR family transcriptional regulator [Frankiales bacterium]|jgi:DNA-binding transcriptional ArsR family regulator|nr:ArsR family transcriptional regulator [Frankiales bacterium]
MSHEQSSAEPLEEVSLADFARSAELLRALGAPVRLALLHLLAPAPRCVHELVDALGIPQPLVSQHLRTLRKADLVVAARDGREVRYQLADQHVAHIVQDALVHAGEDRVSDTAGGS